MSEVKSARELAEMMPLRNESASTLDERNINYVAELIISDRRAIIEKCKEAVSNVRCFWEEGRQAKSDALMALNSVLSEIEKEE